MTVNPAKEREHENWTLVAPGWKKHWPRFSRAQGVCDAMLDTAQVAAGHRVLDIACGVGEPSISAAARVGPSGSVLGTDFVEEMLAFARERAADAGYKNVEFRRVDGEELDVPAQSFDSALCRWGIMFMPDATGCLKRVHASLKPGKKLAVACWAGPERNPWASVPMGVFKKHLDLPTPPPDAPGIFAYADPARLRSTLEAAGFRDVGVEEVSLINGGEFADGASFFDFMIDLAGPIAKIYASVPDEKKSTLRADAIRAIEEHAGTPVAMPGVTWVAHGTR